MGVQKQLVLNILAVTLLVWRCKCAEIAHSAPSIAEDATSTARPRDTIEMEVLGFRLWMIIAFVIAGLTVVIIVLSCIFDCRIPRTKQEIDADHERKLLAKTLSREMERAPNPTQVTAIRVPRNPAQAPAANKAGLNGRRQVDHEVISHDRLVASAAEQNPAVVASSSRIGLSPSTMGSQGRVIYNPMATVPLADQPRAPRPSRSREPDGCALQPMGSNIRTLSSTAKALTSLSTHMTSAKDSTSQSRF